MELFLETGTHWRLVNFFLFVGLLYFFLRRPVKEFWKSRSHKVRFEMEEAARLRQAEEARYRELSQRVATIEQEVARLLKDLEEEGELEKSRLIEEASRYAHKLKQDAEKSATQEVYKAKCQLQREAVKLSVEIAERLIRHQLSEADQRRLEKGTLQRLEGSPEGHVL